MYSLFIFVLFRERSMSTPKRYSKESIEILICLRKKLEALLSSPFINLNLKKKKEKKKLFLRNHKSIFFLYILIYLIKTKNDIYNK